MPSSPKLNTESTISCASLAISSTPLTASAFCAASLSCRADTGALAKEMASVTKPRTTKRLIIFLPSRVRQRGGLLLLLLLRRGPGAHGRILDAELIQV